MSGKDWSGVVENNDPTEFFAKVRERYSTEDYIKVLQALLWSTINNVTQLAIKDVGLERLLNQTGDKLKELVPIVQHGKKFIGRKVSRKNIRLYEEVEQVYKAGKKEYGAFDYTLAVNKIAHKYKVDSALLYARYMKWKNRRYVLSNRKRRT